MTLKDAQGVARGRSVRVAGCLLALAAGFAWIGNAGAASGDAHIGRGHPKHAAARPPVVVPEALRTQAFAIEQSSDGHAIVDLERPGVDPAAPELETLQLLDGRGVRIAKRSGVRKLCATACGNENSTESCHIVGDYEFSGRSLEQFALAFNGATEVVPHPLDRARAARSVQTAHLARMFKKTYQVPENVYGARWVRSESKGDWIELATRWVPAPGGHVRAVETPTGAKFESCSLMAFGTLTEIRCPLRHTMYVDNRFIGMNDEFELGPSVRYSADIDGTLIFLVLLKRKNETRPVILFRDPGAAGAKAPTDEWYKVDASVAHGAC
jgi:hypothetical protein